MTWPSGRFTVNDFVPNPLLRAKKELVSSSPMSKEGNLPDLSPFDKQKSLQMQGSQGLDLIPS
jgi:hypothetical protein